MKITNFVLSLMLLWIIVPQSLTAQNVSSASGSGKTYKYETVPGDPLNARIYTLDNGLKVYMTVYKNEPRIQTYIAVAAGSKNDPAETTGLAHYFEHMMFKGTPHFGTSDYEKEKVLIARVDSLFEVYRKITDEKERKAMYKIIDSVSFAASKYAIPNEYDKLMSAIGATGTNAYTSLEQTVYVENIPSNQLDNWAIIQADRFANPVLRGFHTELETIYEEKNMTMTSDPRKVYTALLEGLFQKHQYGTQTTIGTQEHIKNPSMTNIRKFHSEYYVPNNMAIAISGDFNPDEAIKVIDKHFGQLKPGNVPPFTPAVEAPITSPIVKTVLGPDAANLSIGFRMPGAASEDILKLKILDMILSNSTAGLIDLNLKKNQKVLKASSGTWILKDYSMLMLSGTPKEGQTLDEVRDLLLQQIELIKKGEFEDWLIPAIINDFKLMKIKEMESNDSRANAFVESFVLGIKWSDYISEMSRLEKITKKDIVDFANKYFANNYVIVYKQTGKDPEIKKISKNKLTTLDMNRDKESDFLKQIKESKVADIEPVFLDFKKAITFDKVNGVLPVEYIKNTENETFNLSYSFDFGTANIKNMSYAFDFMKLLGTDKYSPEALAKEFYKLGISYSIGIGAEESNITISGLSSNFEKGVALFENWIDNVKSDAKIWENYLADLNKTRADNKKNIQVIFGRLVSYGIYGSKNPSNNILSSKELAKAKPESFLATVKSIRNFEHKVLYYGANSLDEVKTVLAKYHPVPAALQKAPELVKYVQQPTPENVIYWVNFDTPQSQILMLSQGNKGYSLQMAPIVRLFNEYFGGSMNSVVFQEMREARALAYTAMSFYQEPDKKNDFYYSLSYIATQYDKMQTAIDGFLDLMNNMPEAEKSFTLAKEGLIKQLRANRITREDILWTYEQAVKLGIDEDIDRVIYEKAPSFTLADLKNFQQQYLKNRTFTYLILGDEKQLPLETLKKYGTVKEITLEQLFGY